MLFLCPKIRINLPSKHSIGTPFIELPTIDSTNNYAMGMVHEGMAQHGIAVFTSDQTKGKGQRSKQWQSQKGQNMALTLILEPEPLTVADLFPLSMAMATAVRSFFNNYTQGEVTIKWPNDIYWRDRKAGGILIENVLQGPLWRFALVGIGLNINQMDFGGLQNKAVSLKQITGQSYSPALLAKALCKEVDQYWHQLLSGRHQIIASYNEYLYRKNEWVRLKKGSQVFDALIKEVLPTGQLVVRRAVEEHFEVGEVEWVAMGE
jgi:BirA family transcriptional regulator, biotin operon repressor / biotin---[acetyl-CoA-carboxylase] ligase